MLYCRLTWSLWWVGLSIIRRSEPLVFFGLYGTSTQDETIRCQEIQNDAEKGTPSDEVPSIDESVCYESFALHKTESTHSLLSDGLEPLDPQQHGRPTWLNKVCFQLRKKPWLVLLLVAAPYLMWLSILWMISLHKTRGS